MTIGRVVPSKVAGEMEPPACEKERRGRKRLSLSLAAALGLAGMAPGAFAQGNDAARIAGLRRQPDAMQRRLEQLEARSARPAARPPDVVAAPAPASRTAHRAPDPSVETAQEALSNIVSLDPTTAWGATLAYQRFWPMQLRSNFAYSYARQGFPGHALGFAPGSSPATSLNRNIHQGIVNLIWSPFAEERNGVFGSGWVDPGVEHLFTRRDIFGGAEAAGTGNVGHGIANRLLVGAIARF